MNMQFQLTSNKNAYNFWLSFNRPTVPLSTKVRHTQKKSTQGNISKLLKRISFSLKENVNDDIQSNVTAYTKAKYFK